MKTDRREFLQAVGAVGLAASVPAAIAQAGEAAKPARRKMIIRADDIGMSKVCNIGAFDAIEKGVVTAAAVMLADPGTEDALTRLKDFP